MRLYIDPGTGSMLFAILIGIIGALNYLLKSWIVKLRFILSGGKKVEGDTEKLPFIIFSDDKRYWNVFEPVCRELNRRGMDVVYMTASADDPAINNPYEHIKGQFIGDGNKAFAKLNFLKATMVLSTTPGLDVYQWKRSKDVGYYVHMLHAASEVVTYRMFGIDYYDAVLLSGEYQVQDMRALEKLRSVPHVHILGSEKPEEHCGILSFTVDGVHPHDISEILASDGVNIRAGHHCAQPLLTHLGLNATARASFAFYNTDEDVDRFIESLSTLRERMGYGK